MNFILEHPIAFLGICAGLIAIGVQTWKDHHGTEHCNVIPIRPAGHPLHDKDTPP